MRGIASGQLRAAFTGRLWTGFARGGGGLSRGLAAIGILVAAPRLAAARPFTAAAFATMFIAVFSTFSVFVTMRAFIIR